MIGSPWFEVGTFYAQLVAARFYRDFTRQSFIYKINQSESLFYTGRLLQLHR